MLEIKFWPSKSDPKREMGLATWGKIYGWPFRNGLERLEYRANTMESIYVEAA